MFGLLVLVGLFVALTPGILFRLKGSKKVSAAAHAVLFGVVLYVVSMYGPSYGLSIEGFQHEDDGPRSCPPGSDGPDDNGNCISRVPAECTSGTLSGKNCITSTPVTCPDGTLPDKNGKCKNVFPAFCPSGYTMFRNLCLPGMVVGARVYCNKDTKILYKIGKIDQKNGYITLVDTSNTSNPIQEFSASACAVTSDTSPAASRDTPASRVSAKSTGTSIFGKSTDTGISATSTGMFRTPVFDPGQTIYCFGQTVGLKVIKMVGPNNVQVDIPGQPTVPTSKCSKNPPK